MALVGVILSCAPNLAAQPPNTHFSKVDVPGSLVPERLAAADRALQVNDHGTALEVLQTLLDKHADEVSAFKLVQREDDETDPVLPRDLFRGVRLEVMHRIIALGEKSVAHYITLMEPLARARLEDSLKRRSTAGLRNVATRYFLTPSGQTAFFALVDLYLEDGHLESARICASRLAADIQQFGGNNLAGAQARAAIALFGTGRRTELTELLERTSSDGGDSKLSIAGTNSSLSLFLADLLKRMPPEVKLVKHPGPSLQALNFRMWDLETAASPRISSDSFAWDRSHAPAWFGHFPVIPLVQDGVLYYCDGLRLGARTLFSQEELWPDVRASVSRRMGLSNRNLFFSVVLSDDLLFGYLEDEPQTRRRRAMNNTYAPIEAIPTRKLVAVNAATGKVVWNHARFAENRPAEADFLSRLTINTPPLPIGDRLYVAGAYHQGAFRQWVCCFEKATGRLIWRTYVGEGQMELNMFGNPIKEAIPGHLLEHEGVLYWSTNVGTLVAVDAATGGTIWISAYDQTPIPATRTQVLIERYPGWLPSAPVVWKDSLYVAPTDSDELYVVDRADGSLRAVPNARRTRRNRNRYFLGIHQGNLVVAGFTVTAINADTFRVAWQSTEPWGTSSRGYGAVQGRPAISGNKLLFTTRDRSDNTFAYAIDLKSGIATDEIRIGPDMAGNMTASLGCLTISNRGRTRVYMDLVQVERRLRDAVTRSPRDPDLRLRLGDIRRQQSQLLKALRQFEKALDLARAQGRAGNRLAGRAQLALYQIWLQIANSSERAMAGVPATPEERYRKALSYATDDRQRIDALFASLMASHEAGNDRAFFRVARALIDDHPNGSVVINSRALALFPVSAVGNQTRVSSGVLATLAAGHRHAEKKNATKAIGFFQEALGKFAKRTFGEASVWDYAGNRIQELIASAGKRAYSKQESRARALFQKGKKTGELEAFREVLERYPQSSVVEKTFVHLSRSLLDAKQYKEALREIQRHLGRSRVISAPVLVEAIRCMTVLEATDSALELMILLGERHASKMVEVDGKRMQVASWISATRRTEPFSSLKEASNNPTILPPLKRSWTHRPESSRDHARILMPVGRRPASVVDLVFVHQAGRIVALRASDGTRVWSKACGNTPRRAIWHDGRLILHISGEVLSLDPKDGQELWRVSLDDAEIVDIGAGHGKVFLICNLFATNTWYLDGRDIITGESVQNTSIGRVTTPTLDVSARQVLIRSYKKVRCLDPLTGENRESGIIRCDSEMHAPTLNEKGTLVLLRGPGARNYQITQPTKVFGIDPMTGDTRWEHNLGMSTIKVLAFNKKRMLISVSAQASRRSRVNKISIVVLDIVRGTVVSTGKLKDNENVIAGRLNGHLAYLTIRLSGRRVGASARFIRVIDTRTGQTRWDSIPFHGQRVRLQAVPTESHLLVRSVDTSTRRRSQVAPPCSVFFLNLKSGTTESALEFDEAWYTYDNPNIEVVGNHLIVASGSRVFGFTR